MDNLDIDVDVCLALLSQVGMEELIRVTASEDNYMRFFSVPRGKKPFLINEQFKWRCLSEWNYKRYGRFIFRA